MAIHEIRVDCSFEDSRGQKLKREVAAELGLAVTPATSDVYYIEGIDELQAKQLAEGLLTNPVTQGYRAELRNDWGNPEVVEVTDRQGLINPDIDTIATAAARLGVEVGNMALGSEFRFSEDVPVETIDRITNRVLLNKEIQQVRTRPPGSLKAEVVARRTEVINIGSLSDEELMQLSKERKFGLSLAKMQAAQKESQKTGGKLPEGALYLLGAYWSDHTRHETFNADLLENGKKQKSLFSRIKDSAKPFYEKQGVISAFKDNSAVFEFFTDKQGQKWAINIKGETHNHPTMIEAYGGVATGVGGLLRDILATQKGAKPIAQMVSMGIGFRNMGREMIPKGLQTPLRILQRGVRAVSDYGNRVGVPTVEFAPHHHPGYRGKPMFLGVAIGIMPESNTVEESPRAGDLVFVVGGKTGRDGIGGATGSSTAASSEILASTSEVQIPNAIEEKKLIDALLEAAQRGYIRAMTDCGAGGVGLAVGELGEGIGVEIDVSKLPLKAEDFDPWMKAISESQERCVVAVPPEFGQVFQALFAKHDSSATPIGTFGVGGDNPRYLIRHRDEVVSDLSYDFLQKGMPTLSLEANYTPPEIEEREVEILDYGEALRRVLAHDDICSTEPIMRQFDHEVRAGTVLKPFTGVHTDCPNCASVIAPFISEHFGAVFAQSANPNVTDLDPDKGTAWVVNSLFARIVAVGGNPETVKINNNYMAPRPIPQVMGALKISVDRLLDKLAGLGTAPFTGKDTCSSEYENIKCPYNLSLAGISPIEDIKKTTSADIKRTDSTLVLVGNMDWESMGGSVLYNEFNGSSTKVPQANFGISDAEYFRKVHRLVQPETALSCGVIDKGGMAVTLSKMLWGGDCGADIELDGSQPFENILFNETAGCLIVEVPAKVDVDELLAGVPHYVIGKTKPAKDLTIKYESNDGSQHFMTESIDELKRAWKAPTQGVFE